MIIAKNYGLILGLVVCITFVPSSIKGQSPPSPEEFLGYNLGSRFTLTQHVYNYYQTLAKSSPRVIYGIYGQSVLGRDLPFIVIGSQHHLANREQIKENIKKLTKSTQPLPDSKVEQLSSQLPAILYIYGLDFGTEMPGLEALMQISYNLATRKDPLAQLIRENLLIIISPLVNPDGHAKTVEWQHIYDVWGSSVDPNAKQNHTPWAIDNAGNAWGIDLNRDFTWFVSPETKAMARLAVKWQPQAMLDLHCCPRVFFMTPTGPPAHPMWPDSTRKWGNRAMQIAKKTFAKRGWAMNSGMQYAGITYLGHGLTWGLLGPSVALFMFESIGGNLAIRRADGSLATLEMGINRHIVGTWAVMEALARNKQELLKYAYRASIKSASEAREARVRGAIIPAKGPGIDPAKVKRLLERLALQGIKIRRATESFTVEGSPFMDLDSDSERQFPPGTFFIDFVQPYSRLARTVLDPTMETPTPKVNAWNPRETPFYESTVQNLPLLFGVKAYTIIEEIPSVHSVPYQSMKLKDSITGASTDSPYAYILPAGKEASYKVAIDLMQDVDIMEEEKEYKVRVFKAPFKMRGKVYKQGTFAVLSGRNPSELDKRIKQLVDRYGAKAIKVADPINAGGVDFGHVRLVDHIPNPLIAVLADDPAAYLNYYAGVQTLLAVDFDVTFSPVRKEVIEGENLSKYTAIVLPHGRDYSGLELDNLRNYVHHGGTLIAARGAGVALSKDSLLGKNISVEGRAKKTFGTTLRVEWITHKMPPPGKWVKWQPDMKVGRPLLSAGFAKEFAARGVRPVLYKVDEDSSDAKVLARFVQDPDRLMLDGFMVASDKEKIIGHPYVVVHPVGQGRVIYFTEAINYRGYWYGTNLLFLNSVIFGPTL